MKGKTMAASAAAAGMSERSARAWQKGPLPSSTKQERTWRTRDDPFSEVWKTDVLPLLERDAKFEAKTLFDELLRRHPGRFQLGQLRTLQRHVRDWRAESGPERDVIFPQEHRAGRMGSLDFTHMTALGITIAGLPFVHLLFELVFPYSSYHYVEIAFGETFEALMSGLQNGLFDMGGVPEILRMDNLSAATHELAKTGGRDLTVRFRAVLAHYGTVHASRIQPGESHENGVVERAHGLLKNGVDQALRLRGHRDFDSVETYLSFVRSLVDEKFHRGREARLAEERAVLSPLPFARIPTFTRVLAKVRRWSTIHVGGRIYSVPSRLIGHTVEARLHADVVEVRYGDKTMLSMPRLRGDRTHVVDYRHVAWSLARKPGAFAAYRFREDLFPTLAFRRAYDVFRARRGDRADIEYVRLLHLAASTSESAVVAALELLLERAEPFDFVTVKALAVPRVATIPVVHIGEPKLDIYDALLASGGIR